MRNLFFTTLLFTSSLLTPATWANEAAADIIPAIGKDRAEEYYKSFADTLRFAETVIEMQEELKSDTTGEVMLKLLARCAEKAESRTIRQLTFLHYPQILSITKGNKLDGQLNANMITTLESMAADGHPHVWVLLAGLISKDETIPGEERNQRMLQYLEHAAQAGSACGMVSLAGTYLTDNTPDLPPDTIPDLCAKAIIAENLHLNERLGNSVTCAALRNTALNYLLRDQGDAILATAAMYLHESLSGGQDSRGEAAYILGEAIRRLPEESMNDRFQECLNAYMRAGHAGHPAAIDAVANLLSFHPSYSDEDIARIREQAVMAGYIPFINYLKEIKTRTISVNFYFNTKYLYLLNKEEIEKLSNWAKKLLPRCPEESPVQLLGNLHGFVSILADDELMAHFIKAVEQGNSVKMPEAPSTQQLDISFETGEIPLLKAVRGSTSSVQTALVLDSLLTQYADEQPEHKAIIRVLRLANLHRTLREHDAFGLTAALRMLEIETELGGVPGCTEAQRNDLLRVFSSIRRHSSTENTTATAE